MDGTQQPVASGSNKTLWIVIGVIVVLALLGWGVRAAMRGISKAVVEKGIEAATGGKVKVDADGGQVTVKGQDGSSVQWGSNSLPDGWPSDVSIYSGSTIQYSGSSNPTTGKSGAGVMFQTSDKGQKVADFYKADLAAKGWKIEGTYSAATTTTVGATKDGRSLSLGISSSEQGTVVTMAVETKAQ